MIQDDDALPPHKREGWAERMYEESDMRRKAEKEEALLESWRDGLREEARHKAAIEWAISTGAKP